MSAGLLASYSAISKGLLRIDIPLPADLYIHMPANQNFLLFRKKGDPLSAQDLETIGKIRDGNLIVLKTDFESFILAMRSISADTIALDPSSPEAKATAKSILKGLGAIGAGAVSTPAENLEKTKTALDDSFALVKEILSKSKNTPAAKSFLDALKDVKKENDPLQTHCRHVSALSTLALISVGATSIEDLADIAFAGLIHDLGMMDLPKILQEKHLSGIPAENLISAEKIALMRHIELLFEQMKKKKTFIPDGARRIIEHHHENWSGTGFKGLKEEQIFRSARVLRIIDDIVTYIQNPNSTQNVKEAFLIVKDMKDLATNKPLVDLQILETIEKTIFS